MLVSDYPDAENYRSSLAALLNNQALALAGEQRYDDALKIYELSIDRQRSAMRRHELNSAARESLSKTYFNYAAALRATDRFEKAAEISLERRELWNNNPERLLAVAAEMADLSRAMRLANEPARYDAQRQRLDEEVVTTLWQAQRAGRVMGINLADDERFKFYHENVRFAALVAAQQRAGIDPAQAARSRNDGTSKAAN
jgi:tetratricopeptide (TPR) repeat protein